MSDLWRRCLQRLEADLSQQELNTWLLPMQAREDEHGLHLFAPNDYTLDVVRGQFLPRILEVLQHLAGRAVVVDINVGTAAPVKPVKGHKPTPAVASGATATPSFANNLDPHFTFETFVEGKPNQLGKAVATQVAMNPGRAYNPLLLYGGTGLGKTHLMHAAGNLMCQLNPKTRVLYLRSEQFVTAMVSALAHKNMDDFKQRFRSVDALLIDDVQFFAGKNSTQEEFFHTFNTLFESKQQIIMTCDRYPREVENLEPRLQSRLGSGLSVAVEPPDFETRAAILMSKAQGKGVELPQEVAMLMARRIRSNVRDLEGALNTLVARANFFHREITTEFAQEALRELLNVHAHAVNIPNIQRTVADYYQVRLSDLLSKRRVRSLARPRQMAMALSKELTEHSLPEIGEAFGGRDHTTVLHGCRTIRSLKEQDTRMQQDWDKLIRILTG
ncbi:MAG: chromosomal replication initiator protein DnaA [Xanthomonadales bacterium]|nr:chromosomal replication initiator protein DnaA [Xanthomonadales bacterium]